MKSYIIVLIGIGFLFFLPLGCSEQDFLQEVPKSKLTAEQLYSSPSGFQLALNGLYSGFRTFERLTVRGDREVMMGKGLSLATDYYYAPIVNNPHIPWAQRGSYINSTLPDFEIWFEQLYQMILAANMIIHRAENPDIPWSDETQKNEVVAEARLIRAWCYRHLTFLWGDVPLVTEEITGVNFRNDWERTAKREVQSQMEEDLLFAEQHLPPVQANAGSTSSATAQHYLAELYLILGRPDQAEQKARAAINNPNYKLITERYGVRANQPGVPFMDQFYDGNALHQEGNTEALWAIPYSRQVQGGGFNRMRRAWVLWYWQNPGISTGVQTGGRGTGWYAFNKHGFDLYEADDDRYSEFAVFRYVIKDNGDTLYTTTNADKYIGAFAIGSFPPTHPDRPYNWPSTRKWEDVYEENPVDDQGYKDQPYLRLAETFLLLAEAQYLQGKNELAAQSINSVRTRSNASAITAADVSMEFILEERARELHAEEHRRYTLLRTGTYLERTRRFNEQSGPHIADRDTLFPIPQAVIDANIDKEFPQNPGW
ncbi:RagB/SusD family nutrient uptake outer membrane protein [Parapedobacter tibetensis]|uniref:RagB/SusD family nutrient uptake outer membrane protein n=1 Tax=Parapedobacter tibetensis TaxID=2972951 RepID=UPI00214D885B|nr:RagB/SusD family nutrient uptake outer membrane protein [Parapedobacter tibetensis]